MSERSRGLARTARRLVIEAAIGAGTCHIGSSLSIVDVLAVLYADVLEPEGEAEAHRFLLSKGHAASALYAILAATGTLTAEQVLRGYCSDGGTLHGHPERGRPGVEMTGGSLGHGPAIAVGMALAERGRGGRRIYCLVGDGELGEGSVWEALALAGHLKLDRLTLIVDANGLQGLGRCADIVDLEPLPAKLEAFGFEVAIVDGHDHDALTRAFAASTAPRPQAVIARTVKGRGVPAMEGEVMSHYRTLTEADREAVLARLEVS
ncbi:MAG TPA: transketolase [Solirubrobacteraceae bacterium]|nr:transketolase [Solirubrobacteraceae bacterium]